MSAVINQECMSCFSVIICDYCKTRLINIAYTFYLRFATNALKYDNSCADTTDALNTFMARYGAVKRGALLSHFDKYEATLLHFVLLYISTNMYYMYNKAIRDGKYLAPPHASAWQRSPRKC